MSYKFWLRSVTVVVKPGYVMSYNSFGYLMPYNSCGYVMSYNSLLVTQYQERIRTGG